MEIPRVSKKSGLVKYGARMFSGTAAGLLNLPLNCETSQFDELS